jgi:hypothetical protein
MIGVLIIPTGIGAEIGGHAGDGNPVAKLLSTCCDTLITHPNVVNASDINEMPENVLYVEGSMLDRFLEGEFELKPTKVYNKILLVANPPISNETINAANTARVTIGADIDILELKKPLNMKAEYMNGIATGTVTGWKSLLNQVGKYHFDALAIHTPINVDRNVVLTYYHNGGVNPWGGVEAKASKLIANKLNMPVAHAPIESASPDDPELYRIYETIVDPRIAPEAISICYLHCVLKGLHRAPRIGIGLSVKDVDFLVTPIDCFGRPHQACVENKIPVIAVRENTTCLSDKMPDDFILVDNYIEAAGLVISMKAGVSASSVRRPLEQIILNLEGKKLI